MQTLSLYIAYLQKTIFHLFLVIMQDMENNNEEHSFDLWKVIAILIKNKWIVILITLGAMFFIAIYSIISIKLPINKSYLPNRYTPKSLVILNSASGSGSIESLLNNSGMGALAGLAGVSGGGASDTEIAIKLSTTNSFIKKLDEEFDLGTIYQTNISSHPRTELKNIIGSNLNIEADAKSGILEISYTDIDKKLATKIVNKATDILEEEFAIIDKVRNRNQFTLAEENKAKVEKEIERLSLELITFQKKHNLISVDIVFEELMKQISTMQTSLLEKEVEIESYGKVSNIKDPGYLRLVNEKNAILNAIDKLENGEVGNYPPIKNLPKLALELEKIRNEIVIQQTVYKTIIQQYETLKLTSGGTGPTFQVLEKAEIPEQKSEPSRAKLCITFTFLALFMSIILVFIKEGMKKILNDPDKMKILKGE